MQIKSATHGPEIEGALSVDEEVFGSAKRGAYITKVAEKGGLGVALHDGEVVAFSCLDNSYFFERPFVSLLIIRAQWRRQGVGKRLLEFCRSHADGELWTSTNRSNGPMRALLKSCAWHYCGELDGLDPGDPELFFKK